MAVVTITKENFEREVLRAAEPVLVDFWAAWCGPCRMVSPIVDELSEEVAGAKVGKINIDDEFELAQKYGVSSIPTLMVFKNGEVVKRSVGAKPKAAIRDMLEG